MIRFYDCVDEKRENEESVIPINEAQFEFYANFRIDFEKKLVGQTIVGLNDIAKKFMLGTITNRTESGHKYLIKWCDNCERAQEEEHLFGAFSYIEHRDVGDYVLALDDNQSIYKPAKITGISDGGNKLTVKFLPPEKDGR